MSRLKNFTENNVTVGGVVYKTKELESFLKWWDKIQKDCKPILKVYKKSSKDTTYLLRGDRKSRLFLDKKVRKDRVPKDTPQDWHEGFDEAFNSIFGWEARSEGLFCSASKTISGGYGNSLYVVFPKGEFDYIYSTDIKDLYAHIEGEMESYLEPSSDIIDQWSEDYERAYGEGTGNGYYTYEGYSFGRLGDDRMEAIDTVFSDEYSDEIDELVEWENDLDNLSEEEIMEKYDWSYGKLARKIDDRRENMDNWKDDIGESLYWEPSIDLQEYLDDEKQDWADRGGDDEAISGAAYDIVDGGSYTNKNIEKYFKNYENYEIMISCDEWYGLQYNFIALIEHMLEHNADPRQLSFDFGKKRGRR